jgi:hypothetical protein
MNRNDRIFTREDIACFPLLSEIPQLNGFIKLGELLPSVENESITIQNASDILLTKKGLVYAFVIDGRVFKVGKTETTMKERIKSYNCGKRAYRENGTCSTTNYMVLQSFLTINKIVEIYGVPIPPARFVWNGQEIETDVSPAKYIEGQFLKQITASLNARLPGCTQS